MPEVLGPEASEAVGGLIGDLRTGWRDSDLLSEFGDRLPYVEADEDLMVLLLLVLSLDLSLILNLSLPLSCPSRLSCPTLSLS